MARPHADRNLLFGILALQLDFIGRDQLVAAMTAWVLDKHKPLGLILIEQQALTVPDYEALQLLVDRHLEHHEQQPQRGLAALAVASELYDDLDSLGDAELHSNLASLQTLPPQSPGSHLVDVSAEVQGAAARPEEAGQPTSSGLRFRVVRSHAVGGLGQVSVAHDRELHRDVALKEIRPQYADEAAARARFLAEAEITGRLEHPGVVPVYGLGRYADGRPYYAMRFIHGNSLLEALDHFHGSDWKQKPSERALALRGLLRRFVDVCNAVAYAHSRGVLHRDLKPANVMLGAYGETLVVDWGLAKALQPEPGRTVPPEGLLRPSASEGVATAKEAVVGTPSYMAPEQAGGQAVSVAADVYGLGATLYHLLTGRAPFGGAGGVDILLHVVQGQYRPAREVNPSVPAALSAVCQKAMARQPQERYGSAKEVAADVERWLADEPVAAYRDAWLARVGRWARRHRPMVASAAALLLSVVLALAVGIVVVSREQQRTAGALASESQARHRTREALDEMSSQVIEDWLARRSQLEPAQRAFLEKALAYYEAFAAESGNSAEIRKGVADAHLRVGKIRSRLGQHAEAEAAYRRALELYARLADDVPAVPEYRRALASSHNNLGLLLADTGHPKEAEAAYRDALALYQTLAADFPAVPQYRQELAKSHNNLGILLSDTGRPAAAEAAYRDALALYQPLATDFPAVPQYRQELARSQSNLGTLLKEMGHLKEAEAAYRDALDIRKRLAADFPVVSQYRQELTKSYNNLGNLLAETAQPREAEAAYRDALTIQKRLAADYPIVPEYRQDVARSHNNLGLLLKNTGNPREAEAAYRDALDIRKRLAADFPAMHQYRRDLAGSHNNLGNLLRETGHPREAEAAFRDALAIQKRLAADFPTVPEYRQDLARSHNNLGAVLKDTGHPREAEAAYHDALDIRKGLVADFPSVPDYQHDLAYTIVGLADLERSRKEYRSARQRLDEAWPHLQKALDTNPRHPFYRKLFCQHREVLAATLLELSEHASAALAAADLARIAFDPANDAYKAVGFFGRCIPLAERDSKLSEARRPELAHSYAEQALAALRQALAKGYKDLAQLKKDKDLDPLRSRDDFQKLLAGLEQEMSKEKLKDKPPEK
jgi:serine/threonine-protein kinase